MDHREPIILFYEKIPHHDLRITIDADDRMIAKKFEMNKTNNSFIATDDIQGESKQIGIRHWPVTKAIGGYYMVFNYMVERSFKFTFRVHIEKLDAIRPPPVQIYYWQFTVLSSRRLLNTSSQVFVNYMGFKLFLFALLVPSLSFILF